MPYLTSVLHDLLDGPLMPCRLRRTLVSNFGPLTLWQRAGPAAKFTRHDRDCRNALCSFAHRLPSHWRGADRPFQLALRPRTRRQDVAADRGHRPRTLDRGGDRGNPRRPLLAWSRLGQRNGLPVLAFCAPPRGGGSIVGGGPRLSLLCQSGRTCANARKGPLRRSGQALRRALARPRPVGGTARDQAGDPFQGPACGRDRDRGSGAGARRLAE